MPDEGGGSGFLPGLLVGAALGAALGLLLAPRPGVETRTAVLERSEELRDRVTEWLDEARHIARLTMAQLKEPR